MYSLVTTSIIQGIKSIPVYVEADVSDGMPLFEMVGSLSPEVKESKERVRTALKIQGIFCRQNVSRSILSLPISERPDQASTFRLLPQCFVPLALCRRKR